MKLPARLAVLASIVSLASCASSTPPPPQAQPEQPAVIVGQTTREQIEAALPNWAQAEADANPDAPSSQALASVPPGADVTIFLGTWCGDSRREVPRLWKAIQLAGGNVPFEIHYVGVDREKKEPVAPVTNNDIRYVPTFIVQREGREVGRVVEESPNGIEKDLLALLTGQAQGVISTRPDLTASP